MPWIALTVDDVATKVAGPELNAARTAALNSGQSDPLPQIIGDTVDTIRGYVAGCRTNRLGPSSTIPSQLVSTALVLIRTAALNRLPVSSLHTETRRQEYTDAIKRLEHVSACRFVIEQPESDEIGPENMTGAGSPQIKRPPLNFQRHHADGI